MAKLVTKESAQAFVEKKAHKIVLNVGKHLKANYSSGVYTSPEIDSLLSGTTENIQNIAIDQLNVGGWNVRKEWKNVAVEGKKAPEAVAFYTFGNE
jgi:hypothetical protein